MGYGVCIVTIEQVRWSFGLLTGALLDAYSLVPAMLVVAKGWTLLTHVSRCVQISHIEAAVARQIRTHTDVSSVLVGLPIVRL